MNLPTKHESNRKKGTSKDFCKLWWSFFIIFQDLCPTLINSSLVMNFGWLSYTIPQFWKRGFSQRGSRAYYSKAGLFSVGEWRDSIWEIYHTAITWFRLFWGGFPYCRTAHPLWVPWTSGDLSVLMTPRGIPLLNHHWGVTSAGKVIINCTDSMTLPKKNLLNISSRKLT